MPPFRPLMLTCAFALAVCGCDRQSENPAQPQQEAVAEKGPELSGKLDRTFAGTPIPAATLTDPAGGELKLADLKGKPVLLNLWATWCAPCVVEMPLLDRLAGELGESLPVITVSEDLNGAEVVKPFFDQRGFKNLPQWTDPKNELAVAYGGGAGLPLTVLYNAQGKEVWRIMGGYDWASAEARARVNEGLET